MSHEKNSSETSRSMVETERFYIKLIIPICTNENFSHPTNFARTSLSLLLDTIDTLRFSFFDIDFFFQHRNKTKATVFTKHTRETSLLHTLSYNVWSHLISLFYYSQLRFYYAKLFDTSEEYRQVLGFINPIVDSSKKSFVIEKINKQSYLALMLSYLRKLVPTQ